MRSLQLVVALLCAVAAYAATDCSPVAFGFDSVACHCNSTYCDELGEVPFPDSGSFTVVTSSRDGLRFNVETMTSSGTQDADAVAVRVDATKEFQTMMGYGGAFTDSSGLNIVALPAEAQEKLMKSYFGPEGIEYTLMRTPMAGSDFSVRPYSYDDVEGDVDLVNFALAQEDLEYKIPLILKAQELTRRPFQLFGSPWSPPAWMKTNGKFNESGELLDEMYQPYANYFVKFVEAYEAAGIPMWGLTTQNEPLSGFDENWAWNTCGWTGEDMRDWIKLNLGPTLEAAGMRRLVLMVDDFNRDTLPWYPMIMLEDAEAANYIDGTAIHWYSDQWVGPSVMDELQMLFQDKFLLYTEACEGWDAPSEDSVRLGQWSRAENYAHSILENANHFSCGWVDWNMALDTTGGPNWAGNLVDSPIIIDVEKGDFYKQPSFYAMGHFSKFVVPGAKRLYSSTVVEEEVEVVAFRDPSGRNVLVLLNRGEEEKKLSVNDESGSFLNFAIPAKALQTVLF